MGIMTTISVIIIGIIFITIIGFGAQGRSELYHILRSTPLATGRQTPNQQYSHGRGRSRPQPVGRGRGEPTPQGTTGGRGDTMGWGGGGRGGLAALHHIYMCVYIYMQACVCMYVRRHACMHAFMYV